MSDENTDTRKETAPRASGGGQRRAEAAEESLLDQLRNDLEAAKDRVLRSQAELENYRKRAAREIDEHRRYANLPLMHDLLPVLDNIERAIAAAEKTHGRGRSAGRREVGRAAVRGDLRAAPLPADRGLAPAFRSAPAPRDFAAGDGRISAEHRGPRGPARLPVARPRRAAQPGAGLARPRCRL